jgi:flagellar hook protein FlgE
MDVIGNNIANVNTEGFKASQVTFSELMYQTTSQASGGTATGIGGVNAKQIGLGVSTGSTTVTIETAGAAETTGNPFDLKLSDSQTTNFFIVSDGTNTMFTRAGSFYVDGNGYLCMSSTGYKLMGWQVDQTTGDIRKDTVSALQVMSAANQTSAPEATEKAYVSGILDKNDKDVTSDAGYVLALTFYDDLGYSYTAKFAVTENTTTTKDSAGNDVTSTVDGQYKISLSDVLDQNGKSIFYDEDGIIVDGLTQEDIQNNIFKDAIVEYDTSTGVFTKVVSGGDTGTTATTNNADNANNADATTEDRMTLDLTLSHSSLFNVGTLDNGRYDSRFRDITIDLSSSLNYNNGGTSTLSATRGDSVGDDAGKKVGALIGLSVNGDGKIYGSYDNGNTTLLCQIACAQFANASGLEKVGENCYSTTLNSGDFDGVGVEVDADGSSISTGQLEMSNVDLSSEFTSMIVTQRGFQANSRVITTSDTLLEELINLKR